MIVPVEKTSTTDTPNDVLDVLCGMFADVLEDLDLEDVDVDRDTRLVDLGVESISLVYLVSELQQHYRLEDAVFHRLREQGQLLTAMSVGDIVDTVEFVRGSPGT